MVTVGIIGSMGAGKGIVSNYLVRQYGFYRVVMGNIVRMLARRDGLEINRKNLQNFAKECRAKYGEEYFINLTIEKARKSKKNYILVDGVRTLMDAKKLKSELEAKILMIDARPELRYERQRKRRRRGFPKTLDEFKFYEKNEPGYKELAKTLKYVDYTLENNGTKQELYTRIDGLMKKLRFQ